MQNDTKDKQKQKQIKNAHNVKTILSESGPISAVNIPIIYELSQQWFESIQ